MINLYIMYMSVFLMLRMKMGKHHFTMLFGMMTLSLLERSIKMEQVNLMCACTCMYVYGYLACHPSDPTITADGEEEKHLIHLAIDSNSTDSEFKDMLAALEEIE